MIFAWQQEKEKSYPSANCPKNSPSGTRLICILDHPKTPVFSWRHQNRHSSSYGTAHAHVSGLPSCWRWRQRQYANKPFCSELLENILKIFFFQQSVAWWGIPRLLDDKAFLRTSAEVRSDDQGISCRFLRTVLLTCSLSTCPLKCSNGSQRLFFLKL